MPHLRFLAYLIDLCFERRCPKQNTLARFEGEIFGSPKILNWLRYCLQPYSNGGYKNYANLFDRSSKQAQVICGRSPARRQRKVNDLRHVTERTSRIM